LEVIYNCHTNIPQEFILLACLEFKHHVLNNITMNNFHSLHSTATPCEYIFSLTNFITNNEGHFQTNPDVNSINTRQKHCFHKPAVNLLCFQKSTW
jgi:hypothetical protein